MSPAGRQLPAVNPHRAHRTHDCRRCGNQAVGTAEVQAAAVVLAEAVSPAAYVAETAEAR